MINIIFVCTGNMCRSAMAEGIGKKVVTNAGRNDFRISSMGIYGMERNPATPLAVEICAQHGIDITSHISRPLIPHEMNRADYIFVMDIKHKDFICTFLPKVCDRVFLLGAWPGKETPKAEIRDPMGGTRKQFVETYHTISKHVHRIFNILFEEFKPQ